MDLAAALGGIELKADERVALCRGGYEARSLDGAVYLRRGKLYVEYRHRGLLKVVSPARLRAETYNLARVRRRSFDSPTRKPVVA